MSFGASLRAAREQANISQEALATAAGLHRAHISLLERNRREPRLDTLVKLSRALRRSPAEMLAWYTSPAAHLARGAQPHPPARPIH
jgi:transcriptional regulator with XRE-family HTH domain